MSWTATPVFEDSAEFDCRMDRAVQVVASDHAQLTNRDAPDAHPVKAISGLSDELGARLTASDALTNVDIETLLGG